MDLEKGRSWGPGCPGTCLLRAPTEGIAAAILQAVSVWRSCFPTAGLSEHMHESRLRGPPCCWEGQCPEAVLSHLGSVGQRMVHCCDAGLGFLPALQDFGTPLGGWLVEMAAWSHSYIVFACQDVFFSPFCVVQAEENF